MSGERVFYGFDIGGSKIALGVYDAQRILLHEWREATPGNYPDFLSTIVKMVHEADAFFGVQGSIGMGIPGLPYTDDGVLYAANLPAANGKPLGQDLSERLKRDVRIENDANCFTLSEAWDEAFCEYPVVMGLILGTGVGGGLVVNGHIVTGRACLTGEYGHVRLPVDALEILGRDIPLRRCGCGQNGCIENYLSGGGFAWLYAHFFGETLSAPEIVSRWEKGEPDALAHVSRYLDVLAVCLANLLTILDPHLVVIGGGLSQFSWLVEALPERLSRHLLPPAKVPHIAQARHGDAGGMRGAAFLHFAT